MKSWMIEYFDDKYGRGNWRCEETIQAADGTQNFKINVFNPAKEPNEPSSPADEAGCKPECE